MMNQNSLANLDVDFVRSQFPAFSEDNLRGWGFFENAGGSYACTQVIDRLTSYYRQTKLQPYGFFPASIRAGEEMDSARTRLASLLTHFIHDHRQIWSEHTVSAGSTAFFRD